jgi:hypothetical protein
MGEIDFRARVMSVCLRGPSARNGKGKRGPPPGPVEFYRRTLSAQQVRRQKLLHNQNIKKKNWPISHSFDHILQLLY